MSKFIKIFITIALFGGLFACSNADKENVLDPVSIEGWSNNASEVFKEAKENKAPIMMNFTGSDWCIWCKRIKAEIFETPEFKAWVKEKNIVLLEVDFPRNKEQSDALKSQNNSLKKKIGVQGFPTLIIIYNGKMIRTGYVQGGAKAWIKSVESQIEI